MRAVLDDRLGVPVSLVDDALGLIVVEVDLVLQRSGVFRSHDVDGLRGQALEFLDLSLVKLEPRNTLYLTQLLRPPIDAQDAPASASLVAGRVSELVACGLSGRRAFCLSLAGDALCADELRRQELSGAVQCHGRFVEEWMKGLEDVRHSGGDLEGDRDVGGGGLPGEADGVV
jgi:hypothetical protein